MHDYPVNNHPGDQAPDSKGGKVNRYMQFRRRERKEERDTHWLRDVFHRSGNILPLACIIHTFHKATAAVSAFSSSWHTEEPDVEQELALN